MDDSKDDAPVTHEAILRGPGGARQLVPIVRWGDGTGYARGESGELVDIRRLAGYIGMQVAESVSSEGGGS